MKIVVVGGVAAGMSAAARLRRLDESAEIIVLERGEHVSFANCGLPYHIGGDIKDRQQLLLQTPASLKATLNLDVRTRHEVIAIDRTARTVQIRELASGRVYTERYDKLVLSPGAQPIRPNLPGVDHPAVLVLRNVADMDAIMARVDAGAKRAVVIGGGYIGIEMAESLRHRGLSVDLVEMQPQLLPPLDSEMTWVLEAHVREQGVTLHLGTAAAAFRDDRGAVVVELQNGVSIPVDLVIMSAGVKPDTALARAAGLAIGPRGGIQVDQHLRTSDPHIYAAGDAIETPHLAMPGSWLIPLAGPANRQGRTVADNIAGRPTPWRGALGTSIVKVFQMTAGGAGASEKTLLRDKVPFRKAYLHPGSHAGYYPGATPLHIKILFTPDDGRLLGAQVTGCEGVDKRIDVFATAMGAGLTVFDLQDLELSYAPPYGSAKDAINMAGFVASNMLKGDVKPWYAEDYPAQTTKGVVVDVRGPADFSAGHVPGAICIPLHELRKRAGELPKDRPIFLNCKVGFRSYLAARALVGLGFDARSLSGGYDVFQAWHRNHLTKENT